MSIINAITRMLETCLQEEEIPSSYRSCFHARRAPSVPIDRYISRLSEYMKCSEACYILALIYMDRLITVNEELTLNSLCIHRLILSALAIAAKFFDDKYYKNSYYARVGGISVQEINLLEANFLLSIDFNLFVTTEQYEEYYNKLTDHFGCL